MGQDGVLVEFIAANRQGQCCRTVLRKEIESYDDT